MQPGLLLSVFALVLVAELPDKTMIAALVLGSRYRPVAVWIGASLAFVVHVTLAVAVGGLLERLPHTWIVAGSAVLFAAGAGYLLFVPEKAEEAKGEREAATAGAPADGTAGTVVTSNRTWRAIWATFAVIVIGEFGDLTQLLTAGLSARSHQPVTVFAGALAALTTAAAIAAFAGRALTGFVSLAILRRIGGGLLAALTVWSVVELVRGA
jgi:putative Ca2+/H+ antiporter (TMEM165/GDT1 family)